MPLSKEKDVEMHVHNPFLGVITDFSHYVSEGYVVMRPKPSRIQKLVTGLQAALAADYVPTVQADSWAGKLEFVTLSSGYHRVGRAAIRTLREFRDGRLGSKGQSPFDPGLPNELREAIRFLTHPPSPAHPPPPDIRAGAGAAPHPSSYIYTDTLLTNPTRAYRRGLGHASTTHAPPRPRMGLGGMGGGNSGHLRPLAL